MIKNTSRSKDRYLIFKNRLLGNSSSLILDTIDLYFSYLIISKISYKVQNFEGFVFLREVKNVVVSISILFD